MVSDEKLRAIMELADKILDKALAEGEPFTADLADWAITQAEEKLGT